MGSTRRTPPATPARRHDAPAALVHRLVEEACNGGNLAALADTLGKWLPQYRYPPSSRVAVWALGLRFAWRAHLFERFLGLDLRLADLPASPQT